MSLEINKSDVMVENVFDNEMVPVEGLYLKLDLQELARRNGEKLIITNYITDINDVIATKDEEGEFQVAKELKNPYDWRLFNELSAQADIIFTGKDYLQRINKLGERAENVLNQYDPGAGFDYLGNWRLNNGFLYRNPDIAILSRSLDFEIPETIFNNRQRVFTVTTYDMEKSDKAKELREKGLNVIGSGDGGVDGAVMINYFSDQGYKVMKNTTGPRVFDILLKANTIDIIFITQVQIKIPYDNPSDIRSVLPGGGKVEDLQGFSLVKKYRQDHVTTDTKNEVSQEFRIYYSSKLQENLNLHKENDF